MISQVAIVICLERRHIVCLHLTAWRVYMSIPGIMSIISIMDEGKFSCNCLMNNNCCYFYKFLLQIMSKYVIFPIFELYYWSSQIGKSVLRFLLFTIYMEIRKCLKVALFMEPQFISGIKWLAIFNTQNSILSTYVSQIAGR